DVETLLRQQFVDVVARHPAGDVDEPGPDEIGVAVPQFGQPAIELAPAPAFGDNPGQLVVGSRAHPQPQPVVGEDVELGDVVRRAAAVALEAGQQRVHTAGVVADVPADGAVGVRRGVGPEYQAMAPAGDVDRFVDGPRLDPHRAPLGVDLPDLVEVLGEVDDHGVVDRLA